MREAWMGSLYPRSQKRDLGHPRVHGSVCFVWWGSLVLGCWGSSSPTHAPPPQRRGPVAGDPAAAHGWGTPRFFVAARFFPLFQHSQHRCGTCGRVVRCGTPVSWECLTGAGADVIGTKPIGNPQGFSGGMLKTWENRGGCGDREDGFPIFLKCTGEIYKTEHSVRSLI
jgi:hypothetical protein